MTRAAAISSLLLCSANAIAQYLPATVVFDSADWENSIQATHRDIYPDPHPAVELTPSSYVPAVYVRGAGPAATLFLQEFFGYSYSVTLHVTAARYTSLRGFDYSATVSPSTQSKTLAAWPSLTSFEISVSGLPNFVVGGELEVVAYMTLDQAQWIGLFFYPAGTIVWGSDESYVPIGKLLFADATPSGRQALPWTDLLTETCFWAEAEAGMGGVIGEITLGLYWESDFVYDSTSPARYATNYGASSFDYKLKKCLEDLYSVGNYDMDCRDVAGFLSLTSDVQGHPGVTKKIVSNTGFQTNPLCNMGSDATEWPNYGQLGFGFHQVFVLNNGVYDASTAHWRNLTGDSFQNPPLDWNLSAYWQTNAPWTSPASQPVNQDPDSPTFTWARLGLCYGDSIVDESAKPYFTSDYSVIYLVN